MSVVRAIVAAAVIAVVSALLAPAGTHAQGSVDASTRAYAQACLAQHGLTDAEPYLRVRRFGDNAATAALLLGLIQRGEKSATFSTPALYAGQRDRTPVAGDVVVITDFAGRPGAVVRTTSVNILPFNGITTAETRHEGPAVRSLEAWRRVHWAFFTRELAPLGQQPSETLPVTIERFELLCADAGAGP